ncbi:MAG TPA: LamG-like jellyroll fold domain-containing protein [candidate division Zixibacteria bacterium]|nr:LamG-like jellyroll fold domain-containing protein [candidate division Zixibacteria bacterium]
MTDEFRAEIFAPPYLFAGPRPTITGAPASITYGSPFFVETPDGASIASVTLLRPGAVTHDLDQDQRYVPLAFEPAAGGLDVQAPANGTIAPPGYYILFLVNSAGVPSVAEFVQVTVNDTSPPEVAITAPANGAIVSGNVVVSATASDDVGVTGVQFLLNDAPLGGEVSTPPYAVSWNPTGLANGNYTLTAVARDAAGRLTTSAPLLVTVANGAGSPGGLVAAYAFEEGSGTTVLDVSGNGSHGSISGATRTTNGRFGRALAFDGINDWLTVPDAPGLDLSNGMTLAAWVNATTRPTGWRTVVAKEGSGTVVAFFLHASSSPNKQPAAGLTIGGVEQQLRGGTRLPANTWTHLAMTYDGATLRLYVNGTQVASRPLTGAAVATNGPLRIGGNSIWGEFFRGLIDEVRVYNRALGQSEIQDLMTTPLSP